MWLNKTSNSGGFKQESATLPASATTNFSSPMTFLKYLKGRASQYISFLVTCSAVTGTNVDIALYGSFTVGGSKFLLLDAPVADVTNAVKVQGGVVNLALYPAPNYWVAWTADVNESANTITVQVFGEFGGEGQISGQGSVKAQN